MPFLDKLSGIAKNIGDTVKEGASNAKEKTSDLIETRKLSSKIADSKKIIEGEYRKIGEYFYAKYAAGNLVEDEVDAYFKVIDENNAQIDANTAEIERIRVEKGTPDKAEEAAAEAVAEMIECPNCHAKLPAGTKFCGECGSKIAAEEA